MQTYEAGNGNEVRSWASIIEDSTIQQAMRSARCDAVSGPIALMPDAHFGMGATIGSVIPTKSAIIPAAVGVDIGCGMIAVKTNVKSEALPDTLDPWLDDISRMIPAGLGKWHSESSRRADVWLENNPIPDANGIVDDKMSGRAAFQLGTLGGGNHFVEVGVDGNEDVWLVLHSGSRGIGNQLAMGHIKAAKRLAKDLDRRLEDKDLAYFMESDDGFNGYIADLLWAQDYAAMNRVFMMDALVAIFKFRMNIAGNVEVDRINCHHNYTAREVHDGEEMWITRKGAINAERGTFGVIPGSMGTSTFIVEGLGDPATYNSAAHGSGRVMSRTAAKAAMSGADLTDQMSGVRTWQSANADSLVDEAPAAYKPIGVVMQDMETMVKPLVEIDTILNYKGFA